MHIAIEMQDPTDAHTTYHYEAILEAAQTAAVWRGIYAFATRDGVDQLMEDEIVLELIEKGRRIELVIGLDAVTNRPTLERLQELEGRYPNFKPQVFWNETQALFHPKLSEFDQLDGSRTIIIGSGNLTPGGLRTNFEAYSVITAIQNEEVDVSSLVDFLERHVAHITRIDDRALERAEQNSARALRGSVRPVIPRPTQVPTVPQAGAGRVLVAQVPRAGNRWAQVHLNVDVVNNFFNLQHFTHERVYMTQVLQNGDHEPLEIRPCIYSQKNMNCKIEIGGAKGLEYPENNHRPLLVFCEQQIRTFTYLLLMPGDIGYAQILDLSSRLPSLGHGLPRAVTDLPTLSQAWSECPLLQRNTNDHQNL